MDKTSREYAYKMLKGEIERIKAIQAMRQEGKSEEEIEASENYRDPLEVSTLREVTILLSTGGPGDGFKFWLDQDNEIVRAVYFWVWSGRYRELDLNEEELELVADEYSWALG